jgi:hypothetical protein
MSPRVDAIVPQPRERYRLADSRVREVRLEIHLLEQLHCLAPSIGGFEDDRASRLETAQQGPELFRVVDHVAVQELVTFVIDHCRPGAMTVQVQTDIEHIGLLWLMESPK